jgi:hypothetical protein
MSAKLRMPGLCLNSSCFTATDDAEEYTGVGLSEYVGSFACIDRESYGPPVGHVT